MLYMISYDLMAPGQNYTRLDTAIKNAGGKEVLRSQWVLTDSGSANAVWTALSRVVDNNDRLLVTELTTNAEWRKNGLMISDVEMQAFLRKARL